MKEIDFNPSTMTRATQEDIERIYFELWSIELPKEDSMNNGHGQFTSQDAAEYIAEVSKTDRAVTICSCGAEVEAQPMKAGVCYECYRNPVTEAQQIERAIDAKLGVQEPPQDYRIFNKRQADGTFRPLSEFFDGVKSDATLHAEDSRFKKLGGYVKPTRNANGHTDTIQTAIDKGQLDANGHMLPYKATGRVGGSWDNHEVHSYTADGE